MQRLFSWALLGVSVKGLGMAAHAGAGEDHGIAVAAVGVGGQIHAGDVQPVHPAVAADDHVIVTGGRSQS